MSFDAIFGFIIKWLINEQPDCWNSVAVSAAMMVVLAAKRKTNYVCPWKCFVFINHLKMMIVFGQQATKNYTAAFQVPCCFNDVRKTKTHPSLPSSSKYRKCKSMWHWLRTERARSRSRYWLQAKMVPFECGARSDGSKSIRMALVSYGNHLCPLSMLYTVAITML